MNGSIFAQEPLQYPPRPDLGWANGRAVLVGQGQTIELLSVQPPVPRAEVYTVSLTREDAPTESERVGAGNPDVELLCRMRYSLGGWTEQVDFDWLNGTLVMVPSGAMTVQVVYPDRGALSWTQRAGVIITPGVRAPSAGIVPMVRRTVVLERNPEGGDFTSVSIPPRAHAVTLLSPDWAAYGNAELQWDLCPLNAPIYTPEIIAAVRPMGTEETMVPNGARTLVVPGWTGSPLTMRAVFSVTL